MARPLILGICTSRIKQSGRKEGIASRRSRKAWPELNVSAFIAIDRINRLNARHTDSSSSTMTISGLELLNNVGLQRTVETICKGCKTLHRLYRREKIAYIGLWSNTERIEKRP